MQRFLVPGALVALLCVVGLIVAICGFSNEQTPASYVGYVYEDPIFGETQFKNLQTGPCSTGLAWRRRVINVSVTPFSFEESFRQRDGVLAKDNLKIEFALHVVWQVKPDQVKHFVEQYTTLLQEVGLTDDEKAHKVDGFIKSAYANNIQQAIRTYAREEIEKYRGLEIKDNAGAIGAALKVRADELTKGTPFQVNSVNIGAPQPPTTVVNAINERQAKTQLLNQRKTEVEIARKDATRRIVDAHAVAESMEKISESLTDEYLMHSGLDVQRRMVRSPNHTTIYAPSGTAPMIMLPSGK